MRRFPDGTDLNHLDVWAKLRGLTRQDLPDDVAKVAEQCMLDWFGCAVAGSREPLAGILIKQFGHRKGRCTVIGADVSLDAATSALLNGASGHALDYDDTGLLMTCHSTASVLPAVLAAAEEMNATGSDMIAAFVVGVEVQRRIHQAMGSDHYARGWHTTATYGTFGATAAVAHLLQLDDAAYGVAIGLAASHASGVKANFGTMTKPFHAGRAAENGVNCAFLAARGFTANPDALLGDQGYIAAASNGVSLSNSAEELSGELVPEWMIMDTLFKRHG